MCWRPFLPAVCQEFVLSDTGFPCPDSSTCVFASFFEIPYRPEEKKADERRDGEYVLCPLPIHVQELS